MANTRVQPFTGTLLLNFTKLDGVLVHVLHGATRGVRREKEGLHAVLGELEMSLPTRAAALGIAPELHSRILTRTEQIEEIRAARLLVDKLAKSLEESEAHLEDEREGDIGLVVESVRHAARRKDPSIVASFEKTIRYHGQIAARGHKTRAKKGASEGAEAPPQVKAEADVKATSKKATPAQKPAVEPRESAGQ